MDYEYIFGEITDVGLVRKNNEDTIGNFKTPNGHLFVLCDGMGGAVGGKIASKIAVDKIHEFFNRQKYLNLQVALHKGIEFANEQIYATTKAKPELLGMGTTCNLLIIRADKIYYAHVGDSRIYVHSNGILKQVTRDHSYVNKLVDQGTITAEEAKTHFARNRLMKAMGTGPIIEPDVSPEPLILNKGDKILLCSDGLTDMVTDDMIEENISRRSDNIQNILSDLLILALKNGGKDNISVQLIEITKSPYHYSVFQRLKKIVKVSESGILVPVAVSFLAIFIIAGLIWIFKDKIPKIDNIKIPEISLPGIARETEECATTRIDCLAIIKNNYLPNKLIWGRDSSLFNYNIVVNDTSESGVMEGNRVEVNDSSKVNREELQLKEKQDAEKQEFEELINSGIKKFDNLPTIEKCRWFLNHYPEHYLDTVNELAYRSALVQMKKKKTESRINSIFNFYNDNFNYKIDELKSEKERLIKELK